MAYFADLCLLQDREERDSYTFGVVADNYLSTVLQIGTAMVTITVGDVNDETPVFGQGSYSALVSERTPTNTLVLTVTATDNDLQNVRSWWELCSCQFEPSV